MSHDAARLATTRALTVDGLFANARAFVPFSYVENLAEIIKEQIAETSTIVREIAALSLFDDLISLTKAQTVEVAATA